MADGSRIADGCRIRVKGKSTMTCLPDPWQIDIYNLSAEDYAVIRKAERISAVGMRDSVLCEGKAVDIMRATVAGREITTLLIVDGDAFWKSSVSLSVIKGTDAEQVVRSILDHCTNPIPLSAFPTSKMQLLRGQTYYGRSATAIASIAEAFGCRAFTYRDCLYVVKLGEGTAETILRDSDMLNEPTVMDGFITVSTDVLGYMVGRRMTVVHDSAGGIWRLVAQTVDADNHTGAWRCDLTLVDEKRLLANSESRWEGTL